jgi:hypothetical protein
MMLAGAATASTPGVASTGCQRHFQGVEYCTADDGRTHIVTVDLTDPSVRFDLVTASDALGPNYPSWTASMRQTVKQMAVAHAALGELPLAVAINGDYFGTNNGWLGFTVRQGKRLDGPLTDEEDCDCTSFDRSSLTLSRTKPTQAEIARRTPAELNEYDAYQSNCAGSEPFAECQSRVLERTPADDEAQKLDTAIKDRWYTAVGGGPAIVGNGKSIPISEACEAEKFIDKEKGIYPDWCFDSPNVSDIRELELQMGTVAGITADGKQLILVTTTDRLPNELSQLLADQGAQTGIRFDGSRSSQMVYNNEEKTGNTRPVANALMVYASPLPADAASLSEPVWPVVALPGEAIEATIVLQNDGLNTWRNADGYALVNIREPLGAPALQPLPHDVATGETATWTLNMTARDDAGIFLSMWQLVHSGEPVGDRVTIWVGVLPEQAAKLKADLEQLIEDAKQEWEEAKEQGQAELERIFDGLVDELEREVIKFLTEDPWGICPCAGTLAFSALALAGLWLFRRR